MARLQKIEEQGKLRIGRYPYTYVRTTVMKSLLFKKEYYHKLLKMSFSEIAKFLQESHYSREINELATQHSGADLLELALNRNLAESFKKLLRISSDELDIMIREYLVRRDIEDLKTIVRGKFTGADEKLIENSLIGAGTLSKEHLISLLKKETIGDVLKSNGLVDFNVLRAALNDFSEKKNLSSIENALDRYYYSRLIQFSRSLPEAGNSFRNFISRETEILNILTLLRLKKAGVNKNVIKDFLIMTGNKATDARTEKMADASDVEDVARFLRRSEYREIVAKGMEEYKEKNSLIKLETELYKFLLRQSTLFLHKHPLSVDVILGYMFAKELEVRNLKLIIKGKQLGLKEDFIEGQLVLE